ncbi:putative hydrolase or acyltransferase of alpha/beta superfamily [Terriglobus roseus DSM 18391]|uniref:Putative hydrolase or acyltransferase of alpha/beta superfamily n=1 Tax=Terriglobus roseus (strain DSM 18391 / NRRL B-41598 / KBS 63) TaxID=926566 RepID=I3ZC42_TERRK|nr:alpha/beta hydrolase [Terriglobus roseus]AFL86810.1 putative hydrolase or acyltransferase of alpha/beta superfamily [Terriglobus roseus DSM 18391]
MTTHLRFALLALTALCLPALPHAQTHAAPLQHNEDIFGHPLPAQHHVRVFGQSIAYYDMGKAASADQPVLVLLHGYGSQADVDFGPSLPMLAKHRRVIALDQIGAGASDKPLIAYRVQTYVEFLAEFLRVTGIKRFDLAGESLGGWVAASYAAQASEQASMLPKPEGLILEDAAGFVLPPSGYSATMPVHLSVSTVGEVIAGLRSVFFDPTLVTPEVAKRRFITKLTANDGLVTSTFSSNPAVRNEAVGEKARGIALPTLIVWGAEDHTVPVAQAHSFAEAISGAKLVLIERSGHVPSLEQPGKFVEAVEGFLSH